MCVQVWSDCWHRSGPGDPAGLSELAAEAGHKQAEVCREADLRGLCSAGGHRGGEGGSSLCWILP